MTDKKHIFVIDDDERINSLLCSYLKKQNILTSSGKNIPELEKLLAIFIPDLIILDVMMPGETGFEFTKRYANKHNIPILFLTALDDLENKLTGLETGGSDYMVKPFEPRELLARINLLTRKNYKEKNCLEFGPFSFNLISNQMSKYGQLIKLTSSEAKLLRILLENKNEVVSREEICSYLEINERSVDVQIIRLRNKIENSSKSPVYLHTIRNKGYVLNVD